MVVVVVVVVEGGGGVWGRVLLCRVMNRSAVQCSVMVVVLETTTNHTNPLPPLRLPRKATSEHQKILRTVRTCQLLFLNC